MTAAPSDLPCLDHHEETSCTLPDRRMALSNSNLSSNKWDGNQRSHSPDQTSVLDLAGDTIAQQPDRPYVAPKSRLSTSGDEQIKVDMPVWMMNSSSKQQSPSQTRLKWCGCLASSRCTHFSDSYRPHTPSPSLQWMPPQLLTSDIGQTYQQGMRDSTLGHKRPTYGEQFQFDIRQAAKFKALILAHPLYEQMLATHVGCLRVATPVDHLQTIEAQLATTHHIAARYSMLGHNTALVGDEKEELDHFMAAYILLLQSFKEQLQDHVRIHAMEAVASCWEIEQALISLTGVPPGPGSGSTMSDDEEEKIAEAGLSYYDADFFDGGDSLGLGPLIPTESERSLMERVRQELKSEFKQGYKSRIADVREEILRKRRAGKLPSETTAILKKWWNAHSKWPYPTEDEKARLVQETGLELKQINNWFINQRKRNWHNHSATTTSTILPTSDIS